MTGRKVRDFSEDAISEPFVEQRGLETERTQNADAAIAFARNLFRTTDECATMAVFPSIAVDSKVVHVESVPKRLALEASHEKSTVITDREHESERIPRSDSLLVEFGKASAQLGG